VTLPRRRFLQAAALTPLSALLPPLTVGTATANGPASVGEIVGSGTVIRVGVLDGLSTSWVGPESMTTIATVEAMVAGRYQEAVEMVADHGHGPPDPSGRAHSPVMIVPGATAYRITPVTEVTDLRYHLLATPVSRFSALAAPPPGGYTTVSPMPGLEIIERGNWTDRGRKDTIDCWLGSSVFGLGCRADVGLRHGVVHHTVNTNNYGPDDVAHMLWLIQRYHMDTRGWDDIGYNFVVDRFGRIWHARDGDIYEPISGAHVSGLNTESMGVAVLGTFSRVDPGQAVIDALTKLLGWKMSLFGVDPLGTTFVRSAGGDFADDGEMVLLHNISGHRDNQQTACPGNVLYGRIGEIRTGASNLVPVFGHLSAEYTLDAIAVTGWVLDRNSPLTPVGVDVSVDGTVAATLTADTDHPGLDASYPTAGIAHGFDHTVPIDIDTTSILVEAHAVDGNSTKLMNLHLFAGFIDVEPARFFAPGIYWMRRHNLTNGSLPGLFEPMDEVSRAVMATFLWRFMDKPPASSPAPFDDVVNPSFYAEAVAWLFEAGITTGVTSTEFRPDDWVTRAQMAAFLWRMCGRITPTVEVPFVDVPAESYYTDAVRWLSQIDVTTGQTPEIYGSDSPVTRGQLATFLHRLASTPDAWTVVTAPTSVSV